MGKVPVFHVKQRVWKILANQERAVPRETSGGVTVVSYQFLNCRGSLVLDAKYNTIFSLRSGQHTGH